MKPPEYRVRLFLAVDLVGSTAFKSKSKTSLGWIGPFKRFYGEFPRGLREKYVKCCSANPVKNHLSPKEMSEGFPRLWKTIGDEILFCCRIYSLCHLSVCIQAFVEQLVEFGAIVASDGLNTKGNAWIGSFPAPNTSIKPITDLIGPSAPLAGESDLPTEDYECDVDENPHRFDFLGKGIDSGFRIAKNSEIDSLTLSPGLAYLLCQAIQSRPSTGFHYKIRFPEMQYFKGVANGNPYPVFLIDTIRDPKREGLICEQRELLGINRELDHEKLGKYIMDYLDYNGIEPPVLKVNFFQTSSALPDFYNAYIDEWNTLRERLAYDDRTQEEAASVADEQVEIDKRGEQLLEDEKTKLEDH